MNYDNNINDEYYDSDDIMAQMGRELFDQYIGFKNRFGINHDLTGWASYAKNTIEQYVYKNDYNNN